MNKKFEKIWNLSLPYLKKGKRKNFVLHTRGVIRAMDLLLKKEGGSRNILIPAAIVHDVGWSNIPVKLQKSKKDAERLTAMKLHIKYAPAIIREILGKTGYSQREIKAVSDIVVAHKFCKPKNFEKRLLIDADTMVESFKEQFYDDIKSYGVSAEDGYEFRANNKFYTKTAARIFTEEMKKRKKEIFK
ncbi:MAG: HD domain-containing protein [Parcubacteria group bacterium]